MKFNIFSHCGILMLCLSIGINKGLSQHEHHQGHKMEANVVKTDSHAPIGVMGDHLHTNGGFMVSYRFMPMWMSGNIDGRSGISDADIFNNHMVAPQNMKMCMHMLGAMYAPSDKITLMAMTGVLRKEMELKTSMGTDFATESFGIKDLNLTGLFSLVDKTDQKLHGHVGLSIPLGSIEEKDNTPMMNDAQLAYPMQGGSGTFDPELGLTYKNNTGAVIWGVQPKYKLRFGKNDRNYALGDVFNTTAWGQYTVSESFTPGIRLNYNNTGKIEDADAALNPMMMPLFNSTNSGGNRLDAFASTNFRFDNFGGLRLGLEVGGPLIQHVNGIQMKRGLTALAGLQYAPGNHVGH